MKKWDHLPEELKNATVREYYDTLIHKKRYLIMKRTFDILAAVIALIVLSPVFITTSIVIKIDSKGPVLFRQIRITRYGKSFYIYKFRTMVENAERKGPQVTAKDDVRVTKTGRFLRKCRLDEIPQLMNIIAGDMSFVGTRPEVPKYVAHYTDEMKATLLMPAGVTSLTSILYKDEEAFLAGADDVDEVYIRQVLPEKMQYNLSYLRNPGICRDLLIMIKTVLAVL